MKIFRPSALNQENQSFEWSWLSLTGPDARDFLQRLSTVHVKGLGVGQGAPGCFLTPQGKLRASFQLWREGEDRFSFEFDSGRDGSWKNGILGFIDQYTFSERMTVVEPQTDLACAWLFPEATEIESLGWSHLSEGQMSQTSSGLRVCVQGQAEFGRPWFTIWGVRASLESWIENEFSGAAQIESSELDLWRILQLRPRVGFEIVEGASPLEIGMRSSIAEQKGCYPGQEVIERILSIGSPPRRLVRIETQAVGLSLGESILDQEAKNEIGTITSLAHSEGNRCQVVALVKKMFAQPHQEVRFSSSLEKTGVIMQIAPYE